MESNIDQLILDLKYGSFENKIEALTLFRRKVNKDFLIWTLSFDEKKVQKLSSEIYKLDSLTNSEIEKIKSTLTEELNGDHDLIYFWYLSITLVDLGKIDCDFLKSFLDISKKFISWLSTDPEICQSVNAAMSEFIIQKETLRCLSKFKACSGIGDIINKCFEGKILLGRQKDGGLEVLKRSALYAFGSLGDTNYKPLVEYWAKHPAKDKDEKTIVNAAVAALSLWDSADFDEIMKNAEEK